MSTETHVFFRGKLPTKAALSRAMKELGFPFAIKPATGSLEQQSGFMPMTLRREETGVEFDVFDDRSAVEEYAGRGVDQSYERVANFRWSGDFEEAVAGMCGAAALANLVNGVVFDEAEDKLLSVDEAIALAKKNIAVLPQPSKERKPRGRTVLRRMLAPLIAKRGDLALARDLLVICPVRHLIRGAEFQWRDHETRCSAHPYIRPLYQRSTLFLGDAVFEADIDNPDFAPMLLDRLAVEVFEPLGKIATIEDFIDSSWGKRLWTDQLYPSILLSRGIEPTRERAAAFKAACQRSLSAAKERQAHAKRGEEASARRLETKHAEENLTQAKATCEFLERSEEDLIAFYREREARVAKEFRLEAAWEPTPLPVQLPVAQRTAKSADPIFTPTPWLEFPDTWRQDPPAVPGEVRFARDFWHRQGRLSLLHPITREQAQAYHADLERYVLATRLSAEKWIVVAYSVSGKGGRLRPEVRYILWIYDSVGQRLIAPFEEDRGDPGKLRMRSIDIHEPCHWYSYLSFRDGEKSIHDSRKGEKRYERRRMTDADRARYIFSLPPFGEIDIMWQRVTTYLSDEGFGPFS
jgi:hypothetical protein